jgi:phage terminase small subunit
VTKSRSPAIDLAEATGAKLKNPARFRNNGGIHSPVLGAPSTFLDAPAKACWHKFKSELPHLCEADRAAVEMACVLRAKVEAGNTHPTLVASYRSILKELGATPASRKNVKLVPVPDEDDNASGKHIFS